MRLKSTNEHFYFNRPTTYINNIIVGKMFVDHAGEMKIKNHQTGHVAILDFKAAGWSHKTRHHIDGLIYMNEQDAKDEKYARYQIKGTYMTKFTAYPLIP